MFRPDKHLCYPAEGTEYTEGQKIILSCEVIYHGYKAPTLRWFDENDVEVASYMENPSYAPDMLRQL